MSILKRSKCTPPYRFDTHHHILPPEYVSALRNLGIRGATGMPFPKWTPEGTLRFMDQHGIATAITSVSTPGVYFNHPSVSRDLARSCNEYAARLVSDHPTRFGALASLPLPDIDGALQELAYALDVLSLDGVILLTNAQGQYLGVQELDPLFIELNRRKAVVLVHPTDPPWGSIEGLDFPNALLESPFETTRAVANLLYNGVLTRFPDIRFIVSHAGGTIPFLAWKLGLAHQSRATGVRRLKVAYDLAIRKQDPDEGIQILKRLYYDIAIAATRYTSRSLLELVDLSHILFGTDYVWLPTFLIDILMQRLKDNTGLDEASRLLVERENALDLFPRFRQHFSGGVMNDR